MKASEKKSQRPDCRCILIVASVLFSVLTALLGWEKLSVGYALAFAMSCILPCICKDVKELFGEALE